MPIAMNVVGTISDQLNSTTSGTNWTPIAYGENYKRYSHYALLHFPELQGIPLPRRHVGLPAKTRPSKTDPLTRAVLAPAGTPE
jgi:hypothetical protein